MRKFLLTITLAGIFACSKAPEQEKIYHFQCINNHSGEIFTFSAPDIVKNTHEDTLMGTCFDVIDDHGDQRSVCSRDPNFYCRKSLKDQKS